MSEDTFIRLNAVVVDPVYAPSLRHWWDKLVVRLGYVPEARRTGLAASAPHGWTPWGHLRNTFATELRRKNWQVFDAKEEIKPSDGDPGQVIHSYEARVRPYPLDGLLRRR